MFAVQDSAELQRILAVPRRTWTAAQIADLVARLTAALRTPHGTQTLFPLQAIALAEIATWGGSFVPIPVGGGKTLVSKIAPRLLPGIKKPLILLPAHLMEKTEREELAYRQDWILPPFGRVESYQKISRKGAKDFLNDYAPDFIFCDEAQALKTPTASVTARVGRYVERCRKERRRLVFCAGSGSPHGVSLKDLAHVVHWCIPHTSPLPAEYNALDEWSRALDVDVPPMRRMSPGALAMLDQGEHADPSAPPFTDPTVRARRAFQRRLRSAPGVVMAEPAQFPIPIKVREIPIVLDAAQIEALEGIRRWVTPDGIDIADGPSAWRHAREAVVGFYGVWDPRPPMGWREARRAWCAECRTVLGANRREIDSEEQLKDAIDAHPEWYPKATEALAAWREIEPTFIPNVVHRWITDSTLHQIGEWARTPGLIWIDRPAAARRLSRLTGLPYYGRKGLDEQGRSVETHPGGSSVILARKANDSGRNLQDRWHRNLVIDVPTSSIDWEQMLGRTHRTGQRADHVAVDILVGCREDVVAVNTGARRAAVTRDVMGLPQKLMHADLSEFPDDDKAEARPGPQWRKNAKPT